MNAVMAAGAGSVRARVRIEYPEGTEKARIYGMMKPIRAFCRREGIALVEDGRSGSVRRSRCAVTVAVAAGLRERAREVRRAGAGTGTGYPAHQMGGPWRNGAGSVGAPGSVGEAVSPGLPEAGGGDGGRSFCRERGGPCLGVGRRLRAGGGRGRR